jgi:hypothetical protein
LNLNKEIYPKARTGAETIAESLPVDDKEPMESERPQSNYI